MVNFEKSHFGAVGPNGPFGPKSSKIHLEILRNLFFIIFQRKITEKMQRSARFRIKPFRCRWADWAIWSKIIKISSSDSKNIFFILFFNLKSKENVKKCSISNKAISAPLGQSGHLVQNHPKIV